MSWTRFVAPLCPLCLIVTLTDDNKWYPEVLHFCPYTPLILVGLKSDLRHKKTCIEMLKTQGLTPVTTEQGMAVAKKMGAQYMECSSKEMVGVDEIFERAIHTVVSNDKRNLEAAMASAPKLSISGSSGRKEKDNTAIPGVRAFKKKKRNCNFL
jgi:GTPase SAR1 family protein